MCRHGGVQLCVHGVLQLLPMQEVEPPLQLAWAKPAAATALPQTFTGTLIGAVIELPDRTETLPFPVVLPLSEAWATPAPGSANMAATSAAPAVADTHLTFFI